MNPFRIFTVGAHLVCFSCSPLDAKRFRAEREGRVERDFVENVSSNERLEHRDDYEDYEEQIKEERVVQENWLYKFMHPLDLLKLIKRYHMAGNAFIFIFIFHLAALMHLTLKTWLHYIFIGRDHEQLKYFDSIYYPHLAGVFPEFYQFNTLFLVLSTYNLILRFWNAYVLIRRSIINEYRYKELSIDQVNMASMICADLTVEEWIKFWVSGVEHEKAVRNDAIIREAHLGFNRNIQRRLRNSSQLDLMYYMNVIDFDECYSKIQFFNQLKLKKSYATWHCALPIPRIDLKTFRIGLVMGMISNIVLLITLVVCILGYVYFELNYANNPGYHEGAHQQPTYGLTGLQLLRFLEVSLLILTQVPQHGDGGVFIMGATVLASRTRKLKQNMLRDLNMCLDGLNSTMMKQTSNLAAPPTQYYFNRSSLRFHQHQEEGFEQENFVHDANPRQTRLHDRRNLNDRIQRQVSLIRLIYLEFMDLKKNHTVYLNLLFISHGICISYIISLFFAISTESEIIILCSLLISSLIPISSALFISALVEQEVTFGKLRSVSVPTKD